MLYAVIDALYHRLLNSKAGLHGAATNKRTLSYSNIQNNDVRVVTSGL